jgi:hypothetical protein
MLTFASAVLSQPMQAGTLSFTGNLRADATFSSCGAGCTLGPADTDGDYAQWASVVRVFSVPAPAPGLAFPTGIQVITYSYGGGINGADTVIAPGGFEPYLSLFDGTGNFLASTFFGTTCPPGAQTLPSSGQCLDARLNGGPLVAGNYAIVISAFENMSLAENSGSGNLTDGFTGLGNLAPGEDLHYAFDVILPTPTPVVPGVPEPESLCLFAAAALAACGVKTRLITKGWLR